MKRKFTVPKLSLAEKLAVVLMHGSIQIATDTQIAAISDIHIPSMNIPAYCFKNYEEMMIGDGAAIIQFNKIKPFIEYVYDKIMEDTAKNSN